MTATLDVDRPPFAPPPAAPLRHRVAQIGVVVALHLLGFGTLFLAVLPAHLSVGGKAFGTGLGLLAYGLGARHAFDADHIAGIDAAIRTLSARGRDGSTVGTWFSLGHSTVVAAMAALVAGGVRSAKVLVDDDSEVHGTLGEIGATASGVFLLVRFFPVLGGTDAWFYLVVGTGMTTLLMGAVLALFQKDLKGLLAYSTISHLGLITALIGIGSPAAMVAAIFHIVNHAVFKASLFMAAGIIDHETGTRDMRRLSGLAKFMPITATLAIIASAAMAGVPLLNGFLSKEMFFEATYVWNNGSFLDNAAPYIAVAASAFSAAYSLRFILAVFFGPPSRDLPRTPHEPPVLMRLPVALLVIACIAVGVFPQETLGVVLQTASESILGSKTPEISIKIWHGVNPALIMSIIAMTLGTLIYLSRRTYIDTGEEGPALTRRFSFARGFDELMNLLSTKLPRQALRLTSAHGLQAQLRALVLLALAGAWYAVINLEWHIPRPTIGQSEVVFALLWLVGGACAIGAAWQAKYHRFAALILMGGAGLATCATFVWLSAPDLAVTQLLVEIVTTVLLLLGLRWLPKRNEEIPGDDALPARIRRGRDLLIAVACGGGMAAIAAAVLAGLAVEGWQQRRRTRGQTPSELLADTAAGGPAGAAVPAPGPGSALPAAPPVEPRP